MQALFRRPRRLSSPWRMYANPITRARWRPSPDLRGGIPVRVQNCVMSGRSRLVVQIKDRILAAALPCADRAPRVLCAARLTGARDLASQILFENLRGTTRRLADLQVTADNIQVSHAPSQIQDTHIHHHATCMLSWRMGLDIRKVVRRLPFKMRISISIS